MRAAISFFASFAWLSAGAAVPSLASAQQVCCDREGD